MRRAAVRHALMRLIPDPAEQTLTSTPAGQGDPSVQDAAGDHGEVSMEPTSERAWMLEVWIEHYQPACERFFWRRGCSADLVADLRQETLLGIWRNRAAFRGDTEGTFLAWANRIAQTAWLKHWDRERRKRPTDIVV